MLNYAYRMQVRYMSAEERAEVDLLVHMTEIEYFQHLLEQQEEKKERHMDFIGMAGGEVG